LKHKLKSYNLPPKEGSDEELLPPVFVTDYLPDNFLAGQNATQVNLPGWSGPTQHSGFFTFAAERPASSPIANTFFWFLPSLDLNPDAPILLWLQGGPGGSSLYGMFTEIGPFTIDANGRVVPRDVANNWNQHYSLLFFDNPCGVGWSFSHDATCFVTNEQQVGADVYTALVQFFQLFPALNNNDFYITGESYAGKYIPATAFTIMSRNPSAAVVINLKGVSIGDGAMDPPSQFKNFGQLLWNLGMVTKAESAVFDDYEAQIQAALAAGDTLGAFAAFDIMLNGDFISPTYYNNVTGLTNYFNFEQGDCGACAPDYFSPWLDTAAARNAIHVGDLAYNSFNATVEEYLKADWMVGVVDFLVPLMESDGLKVLVYSGQNDVILGAPLTEQFLDTLEWSGKEAFAAAKKVAWTVPAVPNDPLAGYIKSVDLHGGFTYAIVRGAGHMVPTDQPERAYDLITRLVEGTWRGAASSSGRA
jgi:vitellogenic carboxypeptidase-like protein